MMRVKQWGDRLARFLTVALVLGGAVVLAFTTTASSAVRLAATAYIMDGTTFPTPSPGFMQSAIDDFIAPTLGGSYSPAPLTTPEGVIGINQSVRDGSSTSRLRWPRRRRIIQVTPMWSSATRRAR